MTIRFGILAFPRVQQLDLTAPYDVFASAPGASVQLVWKDIEPLRASSGFWIKPDVSFADAPAFDVICVPGGAGVNALLEDEETLAFLRRQAEDARYVTSVCTGSLVLAAAGLLRGKRATSHWNAIDLLEPLGAIPAYGRVVRDGRFITAGGVTSGVDFGLVVIAELLGEETARAVQLGIEYAPAPPWRSGHPDEADPATLERVRRSSQPMRAERERIIARISGR